MILRFNLLISLLGLLIAIHAVNAAKMDMKKCPKRNGLFPKPGSMCKSYYQCQNFVPFEWKCPKNKHFNTLINKCDWMDNFHCFEKPKVCTEANGKFLKPGTSCKYFYDCCNGKPTEKKCPSEKIFDPFKKKCEWQELSICEEDTSTDNTKTTSPTTEEIKYSTITESDESSSQETTKESDESSSQETTKVSDESSSQETSTESDESHSKEIEYSTTKVSHETSSDEVKYSTTKELQRITLKKSLLYRWNLKKHPREINFYKF
ncbi:hypothetical protein JTE90_006565 [Oedothorax gibbosus]|uniref:Chitin-binding type-2 domain-containing protein n=1 Tax=Oedothorax gibbosus TaxID=931172 RepID=A0AAV6VKS5_9ARAC|nr:hypothetical protein JTE90_006565 [Oedothorax gibbosus]